MRLELLDGNSRRTVLKMMAASFGLAGLTACSRPVEHIFPNSKGVENYVPGQNYIYATVTSLAGQVAGSAGRDPRRPPHQDRRQSRCIPYSLGAATALAQAFAAEPVRSGPLLESARRRQ